MAKQTTTNTKPIDGAANAAALEATAAANDERRRNSDAAKAAALVKFGTFGRMHARGEASLTKAAILFGALCRTKLYSETDAEKLYRAFVDGHNAEASTHSATMVAKLESQKAQVSVFRTFGKPEVLPHEDLYQRAAVIRREISTADVYGSPYNCFAKCNREVAKLCKDVADFASVKITDDQLRDWMTKPAKGTKDAERKLADAIEAVRKLAASGNYAGLEKHHETLQQFAVDWKRGQHETVVESGSETKH